MSYLALLIACFQSSGSWYL